MRWRAAPVLLALVPACHVVFGIDPLPEPPEPPEPDDYRVISAGDGHTCGIQVEGSLWCWGANSAGQLGDESTQDRAVPVRVGGDLDWETVSAGAFATCAIRTDGSAWCWGDNLLGQLGIGSTANANKPSQIGGDATWRSIDINVRHACGTRTDDTLWCWGSDQNAVLGVSPADDSTTVPVQVAPERGWSTVTTATHHTCAIATDQTLWCWGSNAQAQLGNPSADPSSMTPIQVGTDADWRSVTATGFHTCGLRGDDRAFCWGNNFDGQLGDLSRMRRPTPTQVAGSFVELTAGSDHTCGLTADAHVLCWGQNTRGMLGIASETGESFPDPRPLPRQDWIAISAGVAHTCGITRTGDVLCAGTNVRGELGDGAGGIRSAPVQIAGTYTAISAGHSHTCGAREGAIWCWGRNASGQLAEAAMFPRQVPQLAVAMAGFPLAAEEHSCVLAGTTLACWGGNSHGQLGTGDTSSTTAPATVPGTWTTVAGVLHTCALSGQALSCWGRNGSGQVGNGTTAPATMPVEVGGLAFQSFAVGGAHTCAAAAALGDGPVSCWGNNDAGQLGDDTQDDRSSPVPVIDGYAATRLAAGDAHTCAITEAGAMSCWGSNNRGQLGIGNLAPSHVPVEVAGRWREVSAGDAHTCGIRDDAILHCWGDNSKGQLGDGTSVERMLPAAVRPDLRFRSIDAGEDHACALTETGELYCWGNGEDGQVGDGLAWRAAMAPIAAR